MSPRWLHWPAAVAGVDELVSFTASSGSTTACTTISSYTCWLGRFGDSVACVQQQTTGFLFYLWADALATPSPINIVVEAFWTNWELYDQTSGTTYALTTYTTSSNRIGFSGSGSGLDISTIGGNTLVLRAVEV